MSPRYLERTGQPASEHSGLRWRRGGFEDHVQLGHLLGAPLLPTLGCAPSQSPLSTQDALSSPCRLQQGRLVHVIPLNALKLRHNLCGSVQVVQGESRGEDISAVGRAGSREYWELSDVERGALLNNVAAALMDTSMMRQVVDGDLEKRKNLGEELRSLQRRLKQCAPPPPCPSVCAPLIRAAPCVVLPQNCYLHPREHQTLR